MNAVDREKLRSILELDHPRMVSAIATLTTAEQLHQLSLHYDVNDGFSPCVAIARHPLCDLGTATRLYWQFHEVLVGEERAMNEEEEHGDWNASDVLEVLEARFARQGAFLTAEYHFDPCAWLGLTDAGREGFIEEGLVPARLDAVGTKKVDREELA